MYCVILETYATWPSIASGTGKYTGWVGLCRQHHLGLPRGCTLPWHLGGGNGIVNISYRKVIVRWVFADHQMVSPSMGWQYRQHRLWKIYLRYISWGVPCHDILDASGETFWGGVVSPRPSGICCSMTSGRGNHIVNIGYGRNISRWGLCRHHHLAPGYGRSSRAFQTDWPWAHVGHGRWGSYRWWREGSPPMYPLLLTPWTWRRNWVVSCRAAPLQRNIDDTKRTPLTSSVMPGTILLASDRYSILASGRLPGMIVTLALEGRN